MNVGNAVSASSIAQEAMETAAQTKAEAAKGDQQAIRKLAQAQAAALPAATDTTVPGPKSILNVSA